MNHDIYNQKTVESLNYWQIGGKHSFYWPKIGQGPPSFGQNPIEQQFFLGKPSLSSGCALPDYIQSVYRGSRLDACLTNILQKSKT